MVFISRCSLIGGIKYGKTWEQLAAEQVVGKRPFDPNIYEL